MTCVSTHSDASYLSAPKALIRASGFFFLTYNTTNKPPKSAKNNEAIHINSKIIKNIVASTAKAEIGVRYMNGKDCIPIRPTLNEMGYVQTSTPIQAANTTAASFANSIIKPKGQNPLI